MDHHRVCGPTGHPRSGQYEPGSTATTRAGVER